MRKCNYETRNFGKLKKEIIMKAIFNIEVIDKYRNNMLYYHEVHTVLVVTENGMKTRNLENNSTKHLDGIFDFSSFF